MAQVISLKCPNCGATVHGEDRATCAYCGSALEIVRSRRAEEPAAAASDRPPPTDAPPGDPTWGVHPLPAMAQPRFEGLPDVAVTAATVEIPFDPKVYYNTGTVVAEPLKDLARGVVAQLRVMQTAVNRRDVEAYLSTVSPRAQRFFESARAFLQKDFGERATKRHARVVSFDFLDRNLALVNVTSEDFVFANGAAAAEHRLIAMTYHFRREGNAWKLTRTMLAKPGRKTLYALLGLLIFAGVLAGIAAVIWAIVEAIK